MIYFLITPTNYLITILKGCGEEEMKKDLKLAYGFAAILLLVGLLSYTSFSASGPGESSEDGPLRAVYHGTAGKVIFSHAVHAVDYGLDCTACHHHPEDATEMYACAACHVFPKDGSLPKTCYDCHGEDEVDLQGMPAKTDALHGQCIGCHKEYGAGPVECAECHM